MLNDDETDHWGVEDDIAFNNIELTTLHGMTMYRTIKVQNDTVFDNIVPNGITVTQTFQNQNAIVKT